MRVLVVFNVSVVSVGFVASVGFVVIVVTAAALTLGSARAAAAAPPLNIERLLTEPARWQLVTAADYRISPLSARYSERRGQLFGALRYGLTPRLEINAGLRAGTRTVHGGPVRAAGDFRDVTLGANWLLRPDRERSALLLEMRAQAQSRAGGASRTWAAADITLTAWHYLDPVVLSLSGQVHLPRSYRTRDLRVQPGQRWSVTPQVNFAVNQHVTLLGGVTFARGEPDRAGGVRVGPASEQLALRAGLGHGLGRDDTLFLFGDLGTGGSGGVSLQWYHAF